MAVLPAIRLWLPARIPENALPLALSDETVLQGLKGLPF
jgi:hypothetical protein